jgi:hypothetical protein
MLQRKMRSCLVVIDLDSLQVPARGHRPHIRAQQKPRIYSILSVMRAIKQTKINQHIPETFLCMHFSNNPKRPTSAEQHGFLLRADNTKTKRMRFSRVICSVISRL